MTWRLANYSHCSICETPFRVEYETARYNVDQPVIRYIERYFYFFVGMPAGERRIVFWINRSSEKYEFYKITSIVWWTVPFLQRLQLNHVLTMLMWHSFVGRKRVALNEYGFKLHFCWFSKVDFDSFAKIWVNHLRSNNNTLVNWKATIAVIGHFIAYKFFIE